MKDGMGILIAIMLASMMLLMGLSGVLFYREFTGNRFEQNSQTQYTSNYDNVYKNDATTTAVTTSNERTAPSVEVSNNGRTADDVIASIESIGSDVKVENTKKTDTEENTDREERNNKIMEEVKEKYEDKSSNVGYYSLGEEVIVRTRYGDVKITITGVRETTVRNEISYKNPKRIIVFAVKFENISYEDKVCVDGFYFDAYDSNKTSLETYPTPDISKDPDYISIGRNSSGEFAYGLDSDVNLIELEVDDYGLLKPYTFRITW